MKITFEYFQKGSGFYPLIDVAVKEQSKKLKVKALVDSGASYSVFRSEVAEFLGLDNFFYPYLVTFNEKQRKIILENHETS